MTVRAHHRERGVTLIELLVALAISTLVLAMIGSTMDSQMDASFNQLEFIEAQQNARAAIAILKNYVRGAGWGRPYHEDTRGVSFLGSCYKTSNDLQRQDNCNAVDLDKDGNPGVDRIRVVSIDPSSQGTPPRVVDPADPDNTYTTGQLSVVLPAAQHILADNDYGVIAGTCGGIQAMDLVRMSAISCQPATPNRCRYSIAARIDTDPCGGNTFDDGYSFGKAMLADFFIDRTTDPDHPALKLRLGADQALADAYAVAWDIDDLQIEYGIDTVGLGDGRGDGQVDEWCDDLNSNACAPELVTITKKRSRIVAARMAIVSRSRAYDPERDTGATNITVLDHTFLGENDGYRRWVYRTTVALRNNQL